MPKQRAATDLASTSKSVLSDARYSRLLRDVQRLIVTANTASEQAKVAAHWSLGQRIARERLQAKTGYHNSILRDLSAHASMAVRTLQYAVKLHTIYPRRPRSALNLRHYRLLLDCPNAETRAHYEALATQEGLNSQQLAQRIRQDQLARKGQASLLPRPTESTYVYGATIAQVIDGDTLELRIDLGFHTDRRERFRLAAIDCPEMPAPEARKARDFVHARLHAAKTIVVKTEKAPDLHGRYVAHLFYAETSVDLTTCFTQGIYLNEELLTSGHALRVD